MEDARHAAVGDGVAEGVDHGVDGQIASLGALGERGEQDLAGAVGHREQQVGARREVIGQVALAHAGLGGDARLRECTETVLAQQFESRLNDVFSNTHA
ncbi:MAG: hypothetical protein IPK29_07035 [Betaproteobacteria bacterium]|nr:hypothetical protein [Betaproteobacteria bacterium]